MFRTFADVQTAKMLNLPRPKLAGGKPEIVVTPATEALKEYNQTLVRRAELIKRGSVDPRIDNMLKITTDGRKAALDMRLVKEDIDGGHATKVSTAVRNIHRIWQQTGNIERFTQIVFCDLSTPTTEKFNVYDQIRLSLVELGIPRSDIAYIHDADTDARKKALFDSVNAGRVRILLGSTEKMGAGTNVQRLLKAQHDLDAPWRPRDVEQRRGRIERQGNLNEEIEIYRYVTENSFDAYMWQTLETKARFIQQLMQGEVTVREAEDLESGALSFAEIKALASGNPMVMEKIRIDTEVRRLDMLRASYLNQQYEIRQQLQTLPGRLEQSREYHANLLTDIATRNAHETETFSISVNGVAYGSREEAGEALHKAITSSLWEVQGVRQFGEYKGLAIMSNPSNLEEEIPYLYLRGKMKYEAHLNPHNPLGTIASIEYALNHLDRVAEKEQIEIERRTKALLDYTQELNQPFEHEEKLRTLLLKQQEINRSLDLDKPDSQVIAVETQQDTSEEDSFTQRLATRRSTSEQEEPPSLRRSS